MVSVLVAEAPLDALIGLRVEYVRLDHTIVLGLSGGRQVVVETPVHVSGPGTRVDVQPGEDPPDALAALLGDVVRTAWTRDGGELHLRFASGSELSVDVDPAAESWAVADPDGVLVACLAPGELAFWRAATPRRRR
ncbi:DUF6188 family protein [Actinoplanes sp. NPDC051859]|uniref:DUF6188 family protein n=1 Tax=Actinoplanes sp. NPDC051859 TaxID=3363909 RepID=UPI0037987A47